MAPEPVSTAYFINACHQSRVYVCVLLGNGPVNTLSRQRMHPQQQKNCWTRRFYAVRVLSKSLWVCLFIPPIIARERLDKDVPAAARNCWRRRFL
jgi:hypothetical protein